MQVLRPRGKAEPKTGFHVGGCRAEERRSFVDCDCTSGFHDQSHSKLGGNSQSTSYSNYCDSRPRISNNVYEWWRLGPQKKCHLHIIVPTRTSRMPKTLHLDSIITCPIREILNCRPGLLGQVASASSMWIPSKVSASARVLERRSIRYCNLVRQSKGGLVQEIVLFQFGGNIPYSRSRRRGDRAISSLENGVLLRS